jgi:uncharacterized iron-regulated protein
MQHEAEEIEIIRVKVTKWLHNNIAEMQLLMWEFQSELQENLSFKYKPNQFRCWVWDTHINKKEK